MIRKAGKSNTTTMDDYSPSQPNIVQRLVEFVYGILNSLAARLFIICSVAAIISAGATDILYPHVVERQSEKIVAATVSTLNPQSLSNTAMDSYAKATHAAWCYVSSHTNGKGILYRSAAVPIDMKSIPDTSIIVTIKGHRYHQSTVTLKSGKVLHVAFPLPDEFMPKLVSGELEEVNLPGRYVVVLCSGMFVLLLLLLQLWVARPLNRLAEAAHSFISLRNVSTFTAGSLDVPGAVTEVQKLRNELLELRHQYDELNSARVAKDAEVRKLKSSYEKEKHSMETDFKMELASTQLELSELRIKEIEEEFVNSLSHELGLIRSSHQLCDRVLEKLNNKYPSSIVFGAFFKVYESLNYELLTHLAFDNASLQLLKRVNHFSIAQQLFSSGQHLNMTRQAMQEHGLKALAERNNLNHAIYMPISFQGRNLGMFAFYMVSEAVNLKELTRILKNVCDIAARALYQLILYEEAATAARTDLLTDLPNRKYLEEVFPVILERASASPSPLPVSTIVIHPDQLRNIAENSGRVAVDRMLKELARVVKDYVESSPLMQERENHLVRFATEDFVLILDKADSGCAAKVAGQIKEMIESKSTWPGGVAAMSVSQGIATYPADGNTPGDLIHAAEAALLYGRETTGQGHISHASAVPEEYRNTKGLAIDGNLAVFDAGGLLQSVANSQKTGVLTVETTSGRQLWALFENGKPAQSRLGKFKAERALVEFMVTFDDGVFSFQESAGPGGNTRLPKLDESFNIRSSLDRVVMDGALAQDNYRAAIKEIPSLEIVMKPAKDLSQLWENLKKLEDPPSQKECEIMQEIIEHTDGAITLEQIFKQLDTISTHLLWSCLALMLRQKMLVPVDTPKTASSAAV